MNLSVNYAIFCYSKMGRTLVRQCGRKLQLRVGGTVSNLHILLSNLFWNGSDATFDKKKKKNTLAAPPPSPLRASAADTTLLVTTLHSLFYFSFSFVLCPLTHSLIHSSLDHLPGHSQSTCTLPKKYDARSAREPTGNHTVLVQVIQNSATRVPKSKA